MGKKTRSAVAKSPRVDKLLAGIKLNMDERLPCGMTVAEWLALSDEEEERIWDEEFGKELDKWERHGVEVEVRPDAVPAGQKRASPAGKGTGKKRRRA